MKRTYPFKKSAMSQKTDMQNKYLLNTAQQTSEKLLLQLGSSYSGLNEEYVQTMRQEYGRNIISQEKKDTIFKKLLRSFIDPFTLVLLSLALISFCTDVLFVGAEDRDFTAVIIVLIMVFLSGSLKFIQEIRSGNAAEKLKALVKTTVLVEREETGKQELPVSDIVQGDIIHLAAGDMIPADVRILSSKDLFISQSALTGESIPVDKKEGDIFEVDLDMVPPVENANLPEVTSEQRAENDRRMALEDSIRNSYIATFPTAAQIDSIVSGWKGTKTSSVKKSLCSFLVDARGNYDVLIRFLQEADRQGKLLKAAALLSIINEKDRRDVSYEVLMDHFMYTEDDSNSSYVCALPGPVCMSDPPELKIHEIFKPRISMETLTPYRSFFQSKFSEAEVDTFRNRPQALVEWVNRYVTVDGTHNSQGIPVSPEGVWRSRVADSHSRDIFFVALARSMNIPAYINSMNGSVSYYMTFEDNGYFWNESVDVNFDKAESVETPKGIYRMYDGNKPIANGDDRVKYYSKFTISRIEDGRPILIDCDENNPQLRNIGVLDAGYYLQVTGTRLADGGVLARISSFVLPMQKDDLKLEATKVSYHLRESGEKVAVIGGFNSESLFTPVEEMGQKTTLLDRQSLLQACGRGYFIVGILGPGQEPTNHALHDIAALKSDLEKWNRKMVLLFPDEAQCKKFHPSEFPELPSTVIYGIDTDGICKQIVDNMKLKHKNSLPIFIIADTFNRVVFVSQGYTIGLGEQLMKVIHGL